MQVLSRTAHKAKSDRSDHGRRVPSAVLRATLERDPEVVDSQEVKSSKAGVLLVICMIVNCYCKAWEIFLC
jgi:hypothetical protein